MSEPDPREPGSAGPAPHQADHHHGHRHDVWGDDREEIRASEVVEEFASDESVQRRWHEHPAVAPFKVVWRFLRTSGKRIAVTIAGFAVLIAGVAMLVLPGPGLLVIIAGLAILATEYVWAQRLLTKAKEKAEQAKNAVLGKKKDDDGDEPGGGDTTTT
ncbi:MAG: PGPGW domain-containing protein [Actinomycetota bacterium]